MMNRFKDRLTKILCPENHIVIAADIISAILLYVVFACGFENTVLAYASYPFSAYSLMITVLTLPRVWQDIRRRFYNSLVVRKIDAHPIGGRFLNDIAFRGELSIYQGVAVNTAYTIFRIITAFMYKSVWFGAVAAYYAVLSGIKIMLAVFMLRKKRSCNDAEQTLYELKSYRLCGWLMLLLNIGMIAMAVQMVRDNRYYEYKGFVIYLSAMYTFYMMIVSAINIFRYKKLKSPILSASKAVTFTGAMMSVMVLQTAMIARFGESGDMFGHTANAITGAVVCTAGMVIAIYMIIRSSENLKATGGTENG